MTDPLRQRVLHLRQRHLAHYAVLSVDPPVIALVLHGDQIGDFGEKFRMLLNGLPAEPVYCIGLFGCAVTPYILGELDGLEQQCRREFPNVRFVYACNTPDLPAVFAERGMDGFFCSKNCFQDERIFRPLPGVPKRFDAVYDARLMPLKRHELAEAIPSIAFIYYPHPADDPAYGDRLRRRFGSAHYFNHGPDGSYRYLLPAEVNLALNQCRVGLCLSPDEGAMLAAVQYLLCGLPVVTTESRGGRDVWFEDAFVRVVPPDPEAVHSAVTELMHQSIPAEAIRKATVERLHRHRRAFVDQVQRVYDRLGIRRSFADEWDRVYTNGLIAERNHLETLELMRRGGKIGEDSGRMGNAGEG